MKLKKTRFKEFGKQLSISMAAGLGLTWNSMNCRYLMSEPWGHSQTHIIALRSFTWDILLPNPWCPGIGHISSLALAVPWQLRLKKYPFFFSEPWFQDVQSYQEHYFSMRLCISWFILAYFYESGLIILYLIQASVWSAISGPFQSPFIFLISFI